MFLSLYRWLDIKSVIHIDDFSFFVPASTIKGHLIVGNKESINLIACGNQYYPKYMQATRKSAFMKLKAEY